MAQLSGNFTNTIDNAADAVEGLSKDGIKINHAFDLASAAWLGGTFFTVGLFLLLVYFSIKSATRS